MRNRASGGLWLPDVYAGELGERWDRSTAGGGEGQGRWSAPDLPDQWQSRMLNAGGQTPGRGEEHADVTGTDLHARVQA
jgi:hypothetical protein